MGVAAAWCNEFYSVCSIAACPGAKRDCHEAVRASGLCCTIDGALGLVNLALRCRAGVEIATSAECNIPPEPPPFPSWRPLPCVLCVWPRCPSGPGFVPRWPIRTVYTTSPIPTAGFLQNTLRELEHACT